MIFHHCSIDLTVASLVHPPFRLISSVKLCGSGYVKEMSVANFLLVQLQLAARDIRNERKN